MKSTQLYDFTLAANGSQTILADANFYKVLTSTGDLKITRDGGSMVRPMRAGRGEREVEFKSLVITDISGAPNSGTIVVGDSNFIDDTIVLSSAINVRPETQSASWSDLSAITANTPITIFTPASNVSGAIVLGANICGFSSGTSFVQSIVAKNSAPTTIIDGSPILFSAATSNAANAFWSYGCLPKEQFIAAGLGLYFISNANHSVSFTDARSCRYKLL